MDLQELVDEASAILEAPVTLEDHRLRLLAFAAHDATADALGAARLAWKMLRLPELAEYDVDALMRAQAQWKAEQAESLFTYFKRQGNDEAAASVSGEWPVQRSA